MTASRLHSYRPLTTSSNILGRLRPLSRRSEPPRLNRPIQPAPLTAATAAEAERAGFAHLDLPPLPTDTSQPSISRALLFFLAFSAASFTGAAYYSLKDTQHVASQLQSSHDVFANISSFFTGSSSENSTQAIWGPGVTDQRLKVAKSHETATRLGMRLEWLMGWCDQLGVPAGVKEVVGRSYLIAAEQYLDLSSSKQVVVPVIAVNTLVFALWTVASARRGGRLFKWMSSNFLHRPSANRPRTLLTSVYSHQSLLHFLFNNMALWSIGGSALIVAAAAAAAAGHTKSIPEASCTPHFVAFFTTAGMFAATVSHLVAAIRFRRISALHGLEIAKATVGRQASLGSSGAIYSTLVMAAFAFPEARLGVLFLPVVSFPIGMGVAGLVAADVAGVVLRWKTFDHWAHLAGAAFGVVYWWGGAEVWRWCKRRLLEVGVLEAEVSVDRVR